MTHRIKPEVRENLKSVYKIYQQTAPEERTQELKKLEREATKLLRETMKPILNGKKYEGRESINKPIEKQPPIHALLQQAASMQLINQCYFSPPFTPYKNDLTLSYAPYNPFIPSNIMASPSCKQEDDNLAAEFDPYNFSGIIQYQLNALELTKPNSNSLAFHSEFVPDYGTNHSLPDNYHYNKNNSYFLDSYSGYLSNPLPNLPQTSNALNDLRNELVNFEKTKPKIKAENLIPIATEPSVVNGKRRQEALEQGDLEKRIKPDSILRVENTDNVYPRISGGLNPSIFSKSVSSDISDISRFLEETESPLCSTPNISESPQIRQMKSLFFPPHEDTVLSPVNSNLEFLEQDSGLQKKEECILNNVNRLS